MKKFSELMEKSGDTAVFTFGRMNPPTTGHGKLIDAIREQKKNVVLRCISSISLTRR